MFGTHECLLCVLFCFALFGFYFETVLKVLIKVQILLPDTESSASNANGTILMIAATIILAALLLMQLIQLPAFLAREEVPMVFEITLLRHTNEHGVLNYDSYLVVKNIGDRAYDNRKLYAKTYRNGKLLPCFIPTINGHDFIPTNHFGIQNLGGYGTNNYRWYPQSTIFVDYTDKTFHPGDVVQFEVYDRDTNQIISQDTWPHTTDSTKKWMDLLF